MIVFRADASAAIGGGHVARCRALADAAVALGREIHFVSRAPIAGLPHSVIAAATEAEDAAATLRAVAHLSPAWIVVDHYGLGAAWETALRATGARILAIDDLADRAHDCDALLDVHPHRGDRYAGLVPARCTQLLGPRFALLRAEFAEARARVGPRRDPVGAIVLSLGGADPDNRTTEAVRGFRALPSDAALHVVVGALNPHRAEIEAAGAGDPRISVHVGVTRMAELLAGVDLAIGAVGGSVWERCCLGVPQLLVALTPVHVPLATDLAAQGLVRYLGLAVPAERFTAALADAVAAPAELRALAERGMALVDGLGARRTLSALQI